MSQDAMAQAGTSQESSTRQLALARRKAMSVGGKTAIKRSAGNGGNTGTAGRSAAAPSRRAAVANANTTGGNARAASLARRKALSSRGKSAETSQDRTRSGSRQNPVNASPAQDQVMAASPAGAQPEKDCGCGCGGAKAGEGCNQKPDQAATEASRPVSSGRANRTKRRKPVRRATIPSSTAKAASLARRKAMSTRGKAGIGSSSMTEAQAARASNPKMTGRELARVMREQRSRRGGAGQKKSAPAGRRRKAAEANVGAAQDAPWKVGASETVSGQTVTGTMVGRKENMTGDEASTCRSITGTEYMGADIFSKFCQLDGQSATAPSAAKKVTVTSTSHGNPVSGDRTGRASNVTGNEPGTCKNVTGGEYISAEQTQGYCGEFANKSPRKVSMAETLKGKAVTGNNVGRSESVTGDEYGMRQSLTGTQYTKASDIGTAPAKVGMSATLRGGSVTGTMIGRREKMTGDEAGSCRNVSGDDYIGKEQYSGFCETTPDPKDRKVGMSQTLGGGTVTGSMAGRSGNVTGDEPGTCKAVTGTPYAGGEQYKHFCDPQQSVEAAARMQPATRTWAKPMTGQQPGIGGNLTGAGKGACEAVSGTPYTGADQVAAACPARAAEPVAAEPGSPDFPQSLGQQAAWEDFSITAPAHASQIEAKDANVTGLQYERGNITGPFGMADGKVTGTEQARFGSKNEQSSSQVEVPATAESIDGRVKSRISGEGMDAGQRITGDDWDRGNHVTGTEGLSATRRNPTIRSAPMNPMPAASMVRAEDIPMPVSKVTGGSGNTENGSLITYSGGARG
jgi:Carboxysome shell peptide mid-region